MGFSAKPAHTFRNRFGVHAIFVTKLLSPEDSPKNHSIGLGERLRQRLFKHFASHRIRARFENRPKPSARPSSARRFDRGAHGGWVVREVVNDQNSVNLAPD